MVIFVACVMKLVLFRPMKRHIGYILRLFCCLLVACQMLYTSVSARPSKSDSGYRKTVIVAGDFDYPPFSFLDENGSPKGLDVDLMRRIAKNMNFDVKFELYRWNEAISLLKAGKVDALMGILYTERRNRFFDFSIPHTAEYYAIFVRRDSLIKDLDDLYGKDLITLKSDASIENFLKPLGLTDKITHTDSLPLALEMLNSGNHDYVLAPYSIGMETIKKLQHDATGPAGSRLKAVGPPLMPSLYRFAVRKGDYNLLQQLNEGIDYLKTNGEMAQITDKWITKRQAPLSRIEIFQIAAVITIPIIFIIVALFLWSWALKKEVRKKSDKLLKATIEAKKASDQKSRFLAIMSHEIRTPLNTILGFSQILLSDSRSINLPGEFRQFLQNIKTSGERLSTLVGNILDISKIEAGKAEVVFENVNLIQILQEIHQNHKPRTIEKGIIFDFGYNTDLPTTIQSDRAKLFQIMNNLVDNAIKFTSEGKSVWLKARRHNQTAILQVEDEGIGIPHERLASIFKPFDQVEPLESNENKGAGLGLAIVRELISLLDGSISIESEPGKGSCFTVNLPLHEVEVSSNDLRQQNRVKLAFANDNRVLVIDDSRRTRELAEAFFTRFGLSITTAGFGYEGIERAEKLNPDLIFLDIHLPDMDGFSVAQAIKKQPGNNQTPIVIISADARQIKEKAALTSGASGFLTKPIRVESLLPILKQYLRLA